MKVVWTFNPFDKNKDLYLQGKQMLNALFNKRDSLSVVYVASNAEVELATAFDIPIEERYSDFPKKLIHKQLKKLLFKKTQVEVLFEKSLSLTAIVQRFVDYTKKNNVDVIVTATNSKLKLPQIIFGNFAESLVHISNCDLLIYHQKTKNWTEAPFDILYAHDFSQKGEQGLIRLIEYIIKWDSFLTIVHVAIPKTITDSNDFENKTVKYGQKLELFLAEKKIKFKLNIVYKISPIVETLLNFSSKSNSNIIAVTAQSNKLTTLLGGSVTRQVIRKSKVPILVLKI